MHRTWRAGRFLLAVSSLFAVLALAAVVWLGVDLHAFRRAAGQLQAETVPWTLERQRLGRNLEQLRLEGQRVLMASSPASRQDALFLVHVLSAQPGMADDPRTASLAAEVEGFLQRIGSPAAPADIQAWEALSSRLRLMADDLSVEGGKRMSHELAHLSNEIDEASYKLFFNLLLVAGFVVVFLRIVQRYLIRPLQRIQRVLSSLDARLPAPAFPPGPMAEIRAVEDAIVRFHATLRENDEVRLRLERLATTDGLTGLFNRHHFMGLAADEMARAARYGRPATGGRSPSRSPTSTTSSRSTTPSATRRATTCCGPLPGCSAKPCARPTGCAATAARSSPSCFPRPRRRRPCSWPSGCAPASSTTPWCCRTGAAWRSPSAWGSPTVPAVTLRRAWPGPTWGSTRPSAAAATAASSPSGPTSADQP